MVWSWLLSVAMGQATPELLECGQLWEYDAVATNQFAEYAVITEEGAPSLTEDCPLDPKDLAKPTFLDQYEDVVQFVEDHLANTMTTCSSPLPSIALVDEDEQAYECPETCDHTSDEAPITYRSLIPYADVQGVWSYHMCYPTVMGPPEVDECRFIVMCAVECSIAPPATDCSAND